MTAVNRAAESSLSLTYVLSWLHYDPVLGNLIWVRRPAQKVRAGDIAGTLDKEGYCQVGLGGRIWFAHRLAWFIYFGKFPQDEIDHVNGNRADNSITNLRPATRKQNGRNSRKRMGLSSPYKGVSWRSDLGKWQVFIKVDGKNIYLGSFSDGVEAAKEYDRAAIRYFHEYKNLNFPELLNDYLGEMEDSLTL